MNNSGGTGDRTPSSTNQNSQQASLKHKLRDSFIVAGLGIMACYKYLEYFTFTAFPKKIIKDKNISMEELNGIFASELTLTFLLMYISAFAGITLSARAKLPLYLSKNFKLKYIPLMVMAGVLLAPVSYFLYDRQLMVIEKYFYPKDFFDALWIMLSGGVMEEIAARLGMLTILVSLLKKQNRANLLNSMFIAIMSLKAINFTESQDIGIFLILIPMLGAFTTNYALGWVRIKYGIIASIILGLSFHIKYPLYALFVLN